MRFLCRGYPKKRNFSLQFFPVDEKNLGNEFQKIFEILDSITPKHNALLDFPDVKTTCNPDIETSGSWNFVESKISTGKLVRWGEPISH